MNAIIETALSSELKSGGSLNFANLCLISAHAVEIFSAEVKKQTGEQKMQMALRLLPQITEDAVAHGYASEEQAKKLRDFVSGAIDIARNVIDAFVAVANNPAVLAVVEDVEEAVEACCASLKRKR